MELFNVMATSVNVFGQTFDVSLNWIGNLIRLLCGAVGVVGVGIILFSLALKLITMPLDIYQRISMRKQNLQMKENKEKMEKLQKQYANDKNLYNQKVMEMYKANGISVFSSCLPLIVSMVIFIVAINAFNAYAQYSNIENYNTMVNAYNDKMYTYVLDDEELNETFISTRKDKDSSEKEYFVYSVADTREENTNFLYYEVKDLSAEKKTGEALISYIKTAEKVYFIDETKAATVLEKEYGDSFDEAKAVGEGAGEYIKGFIEGKAQDAVVVTYEGKVAKNTSFLWIKNIWVTDAIYKKPVMDAESFATEAKREEFEVRGNDVEYGSIGTYTNAYKAETYNHVTKKLDVQKGQANGYFILIALSIGTILLQQFVMQRSQKEQQKYGSVDGAAGGTQKMTMIIMTGMFAIFSFMYSSAFSIYMITSNLFSMASTLVINKLVDVRMAKKATAASIKKYENHAADRIEKAKNAGKESAEESKNKNK